MQANRYNFGGMGGASAGGLSCSAGKTAVRKTVKKSSNSKAQQKKTIPYRFKELSTAILHTRDSGSARRAMIRARSKASLLRQKQGGGEYDTWELMNAVMHADAMVRAARKRMKHFLMEEEAKRKQEDPAEEALERQETMELMSRDAWESDMQDELCKLSDEEQKIAREMAQELAREMQRLMEETMRETMRAAQEETANSALDETLQGVVGDSGKMKPEELERLKKKHRSDELREIMEADMKYLRALFDKLAKEKQSISSGLSSTAGDQSVDIAAATLELSGVEAPVEAAMPVPVDSAVGGSVDIAI